MCVDSSFVPPLIYAVLGSSRDLAVGPVSIASLILGSMLRQEVSPTEEPLLFLQLALTSTFFAGLFQASLGILRWSLSHPTRWSLWFLHGIKKLGFFLRPTVILCYAFEKSWLIKNSKKGPQFEALFEKHPNVSCTVLNFKRLED